MLHLAPLMVQKNHSWREENSEEGVDEKRSAWDLVIRSAEATNYSCLTCLFLLRLVIHTYILTCFVKLLQAKSLLQQSHGYGIIYEMEQKLKFHLKEINIFQRKILDLHTVEILSTHVRMLL